MTCIIDKWYELRKSCRTRGSDSSVEVTERIEGGLRTTTFFPRSAFLPREEQIKIVRQARKEIDERISLLKR